MNKYVCLLRAVNVASKNKINMKALKLDFENLGFDNVTYYLHTGNLVFKTELNNKNVIKELIEKMIAKNYGHEITAIIKNKNEFLSVIKNNPFKLNLDLNKIYVTFLSSIPSPEFINKIHVDNESFDKWIIVKDCVYVYVENGYSTTKINNNWFESKFKLKATSRNWNSILATSKLFE